MTIDYLCLRNKRMYGGALTMSYFRVFTSTYVHTRCSIFIMYMRAHVFR